MMKLSSGPQIPVKEIGKKISVSGYRDWQQNFCVYGQSNTPSKSGPP